MRPEAFIKAARGESPCDVLLENARIVDVFSGGIIADRGLVDVQQFKHVSLFL